MEKEMLLLEIAALKAQNLILMGHNKELMSVEKNL